MTEERFSPALLTGADPAEVDIPVGVLIPRLGLAGFYDDNLLRAENDEIETFGFAVAPGLTWQFGDAIRRFTADWLLEAGFHEDSSTDDYVDNRVRALFDYQPTDRFRADIRGEYKDSRDARGTGRALGELGPEGVQDEPDEWHAFGVEGNIGYGAPTARGRIELTGGHITKEYDNNRAFTYRRDRDDTYGAGRFYWRVGGRTTLVLEGRVTDYSYDTPPIGQSSLDSVVWRALVGATWEATGKTTGFAKVGYMDKNFDASDRDDDDAVTWEVGVEWRPREYSIFTLSTARDYGETNGTGDAIRRDDVTLTWMHAWRERLTTTAELSYTAETFDPTTRDDDVFYAGFRVDYAMRRWLTLGASWRYDDRDSNVDPFDYTRNVFLITANITL
jgi:hypothetical protein